MKKQIGFILAAVTVLSVASCGKYEEGPGFSLRSKKARITGVWDAKEYVQSNGTVTADTDPETLELTKDGSAIYNSNDPNGSFSLNGTWDFASDKEQVELTFTFFGSSDTERSTIVRLTNDEMWLKDTDGDMIKYEKK